MDTMTNEATERTLLPRFGLRALLAILTVAAVLFLIVGTAFRGQNWAFGATIGLLSLAVTALVHAAWFGVVWLFAQMPSRRSTTTVTVDALTSNAGIPTPRLP
jgi:hypothetical protein